MGIITKAKEQDVGILNKLSQFFMIILMLENYMNV